MPERYVNIDIDPKTGDFEVSAEGFKGKGCKDVLKLFEKMGKVKQEKLKPEYHEQPTQTVVKVGQ